MFTHLLKFTVFLILHANNIQLTILILECVQQSIYVKIVHGHHVQLEKLAKINVGLLITKNITYLISLQLLELNKWKLNYTTMVLFLVVSRLQTNLKKHTKAESIKNIMPSQAWTTRSQSLVGELMQKLELNIGSEEPHGEPIGENTDSLNFQLELTITWELRLIAQLDIQLINTQEVAIL